MVKEPGTFCLYRPTNFLRLNHFGSGRKTAVRGRLRPGCGLYENRLFVRGAVNSSSVISFCVICSQEPKRIFRHL